MVEAKEEWEEKLLKGIAKTRRPVEIKIHEMYKLYYGQGGAKIGSFTRKAKGREYISPRILLKRYFKKHIGRRCEVLEGKTSIEGRAWMQDCDVLVLFLSAEKRE